MRVPRVAASSESAESVTVARREDFSTKGGDSLIVESRLTQIVLDIVVIAQLLERFQTSVPRGVGSAIYMMEAD